MPAPRKSHSFDFKTQYGLGLDPQDDELAVGFSTVVPPPALSPTA